jgi:hypothetical protein
LSGNWHTKATRVPAALLPGRPASPTSQPPDGARTGLLPAHTTRTESAKGTGAKAIGTGRSHSRSLVLDLGADRFVALDEERLEDAVRQAVLVFDAAGGEVLAESAWVVKPGGTLVSVAAFPPFGREDAREIPRSAGCTHSCKRQGVQREGRRRACPEKIVLQP